MKLTLTGHGPRMIGFEWQSASGHSGGGTISTDIARVVLIVAPDDSVVPGPLSARCAVVVIERESIFNAWRFGACPGSGDRWPRDVSFSVGSGFGDGPNAVVEFPDGWLVRHTSGEVLFRKGGGDAGSGSDAG